MIGRLFAGRSERVRRQAADWIARLNGPHGREDREAFERWYGADPDHAAAYNRMARLFETAEALPPWRDVAVAEPLHERAQRPWFARPAFAALAVAAGLAGLTLALLPLRDVDRSTEVNRQLATFTATDSKRNLRLADGSQVVLARDSALEIDIDGAARRLRLVRGEGQFTVFRDPRPFVVDAAGTEVVARGTRFVVRLGRDETLVSLIEGKVDVVYPPAPRTAARRTASLVAGERLVVPVVHLVPGDPVGRPAAPSADMVAFDDAPLAAAAAEINHSSVRQVRLADPALADLRLTGAFRAGDGEAFARGAAAALDLAVDEGAGGSLLLGARRAPAR